MLWSSHTAIRSHCLYQSTVIQAQITEAFWIEYSWMWHHVSLCVHVQPLITFAETSITLLNILPNTSCFEKIGAKQNVTNGLSRTRKHI